MYCNHRYLLLLLLLFTTMHQEWTEDMSTDPLNKRPMSDIYPQGPPPCSQLAPSLREVLPPPPPPLPDALGDLPPPLMAYLTLLHQHICQLTLQVQLLQQPPRPPTKSQPSNSNNPSLSTSQHQPAHLPPSTQSYSQVAAQSLPPTTSVLHHTYHLPRDRTSRERSKQLKALIRAKSDQQDRLTSLLRSSNAPPVNTTSKIRPPVVPIASLTIEVPLSDEAQADPIYSVSAVIEAMTDIKILNANIISTNKFEVFLPVTSREPLQALLQEKNLLRIPAPITSQDLLRRTSSYNRSRTPAMRQATLDGFSTELQLQLLDLAQERIPRLHPDRQGVMLRAIHYDRKALLSKDPRALRSLLPFSI